MQEEWHSLWSTGGKNQNLQKRYFIMQGEWHSANTLLTMVHRRGKSKSTKEVFRDARRVALSKHITHYGPREGKIKIYKRGIS